VTATIGSGGTATTVPVTISIAAGATLGLRTVTVTTPAGTSLPFLGFTVTSAPSITFTPATGFPGTVVTINGKHWSAPSAVTFNGVPAASFSVSTNSSQLITNPGFEGGNLTGWTKGDQGNGTFYAASGSLTPVSGFPTAGAHTGTFYAVSDMTFQGSHLIIHPFAVSAAASRVTLSFSLFVNDWDSGPVMHAAGLDYTAFPNQHARVDILSGSAPPFDTGAGVLRNFYLGVDSHSNPNPYRNYSFDITDLVSGGGTFQLRFAEVNNV
jgi:hypothetical protein